MRSAMHRGNKAVLGTETRKSLRKISKTETTVKEEPCETAVPPSSPTSYHLFHEPTDIVFFRKRLLDWYHKEKRELPWRTVAVTESDLDIRTYAVWVSEIMLQQTQVATVINYYQKWMKRWPTVQDLATATLEEVNQMWAGLGYYSRGKRLHEGAQKVMSELKGKMPRTVETLQKQLPGVGRYTAGAIGSIALGQVTGAVDGNVIRVLCRVRAIGADCTSPAVTEALWNIANTLVDPKRPGCFNQAVMELGARVCTPKGPLCSKCPIQAHCHSYHKVQTKQEGNSKRLLGELECAALPDIEDCTESGECKLCPEEPWDSELGVQNFPRKPVKKPPREERTLTFVVARLGEGEEDQFLLTQRPNKGLLAGMWEFPSLLLETESSEKKQKGALCAEVGSMLGLELSTASIQHVGDVVHIFSHIHQTYVVYSICLKDFGVGGKLQSKNRRWVTRSALQEAAVSTGVKKIMKLYDSRETPKGHITKAGKRKTTSGVKKEQQQNSKKPKLSAANSGSKQLSLSSYFKTKTS